MIHGGARGSILDDDTQNPVANSTITDISITNTDMSSTNWVSNCSVLEKLDLTNNYISDLKGLGNLKNLTNLNLRNNLIIDVTPLINNITYNGDSDKLGTIKYTVLDLRNNSLDGYTVADNISALLKLHAAGLQKVYITGNNFSENEIQELINGKTIDGVSYSGFGSGNVIN